MCQKIGIVALSIVSLSFAPVHAQTWQKVNGENPIDAGESLAGSWISFASVAQPDGDILYTFRSQDIGQVMGRLRAGESPKAWQIYGDDRVNPVKWRESTTVATSINHSIGNSKRLRLFEHPDETDGLFGVQFRTARTGRSGWDTHTFPTSFVLMDGEEGTFADWVNPSPNAYKPIWATDLIESWQGNDKSDFVLDTASGIGLVAGIFGSGTVNPPTYSQLTAVRYDHSDNESWHRWDNSENNNNGGWHDALNWPDHPNLNTSKDVFILGEAVPAEALWCRAPRVTRIPASSEQYLVTFLATAPGTGNSPFGVSGTGSLKVCHYDSGDSTNPWKWWGVNGGNEEFRVGVQESDYDFLLGVGDGSVHREQLVWDGGSPSGDQVVVVQNVKISETRELREVLLDVDVNSFTPEEATIATDIAPPDDDLDQFALAVHADDTLWLAYTTDTGGIHLLTKASGSATWTSLGNIFSSAPTESLSPVGIQFVGDINPEPLIFVVSTDNNNGTRRLFAIAEKANQDFWNDEQEITINAPPGPVELSPQDFVEVSRASTASLGHMALDSDDYIYGGATGDNASSRVIAPGVCNQDNQSLWGTNRNQYHAGGSDVADFNGQVYIPERLIGRITTTRFGEFGRVEIWDADDRDVDVPSIPSDAELPIPPDGRFAFPADVAVDEVRRLIYVSHSLKDRIDVYDLQTDPVHLGDSRSWCSGNCGDMLFPRGIDVDENGDLWVVDSENHRILKFAIAYQPGSPPTVTATSRSAWGSLGRNAEQFLYPDGIVVSPIEDRIYISEPVNRRIQVFDKEMNFQYEWGTWTTGGLKHEFDTITGIACNTAGDLLVAGRTGNSPSIIQFGSAIPASPSAPGPQIESAISRKTHMTSPDPTNFDIDLLGNTPNFSPNHEPVESRSGGPTKIIIEFDEPIFAANGDCSDIRIFPDGAGVCDDIVVTESTELTIGLTPGSINEFSFAYITFPGIRNGVDEASTARLVVAYAPGDFDLNGAAFAFNDNPAIGPVDDENFTADFNLDGIVSQSEADPDFGYVDPIPSAQMFVVSAVSRKNHGALGPYDINLLSAVHQPVESRSGGPTEIVVRFSEEIFPDTGDCSDVELTQGTCEEISVCNNELTIVIAEDSLPPFVQTVISFPGIRNQPHDNTTLDTVSVTYVPLDFNLDGSITTEDTTGVKSNLGAITVANFPGDFDLDGQVELGPEIIAAKSSKYHGPAGNFDIDLLNTPVESRGVLDPDEASAATHFVVVTFDQAVSIANGCDDISLTAGTCISAFTIPPLHVDLFVGITGLNNKDSTIIAFPGIVSADGDPSFDTQCFRYMLYDFDLDGSTTVSDAINISVNVGPVTGMNFTGDVDLDGFVTVAEAINANTALGTSASCP